MNQQTPGIGDNTQVDYGAEENRRLVLEYGELVTSVHELIETAGAIPLPIADDDAKANVAKTIKEIRDAATRVEGFREIEKLPHLRRGNAVDQFFGGLRIALRKDNKRDRDAIGDTLAAALTSYDARKLAEEQERRRLEAERTAREAAEARRKAEEEARRVEEARLAAERARKPETAAAKEEVAQKVEEAASIASVQAALAESRAEEAHINTLARPADVMRQRGAGGVMTTMATEKFAEVLDLAVLREPANLAKIAPFLKIEAIEQALRGYAASVGYSNDTRMQVPGALFGTRAKSVVR